MAGPFQCLLLATEHTEQDHGAEALAFVLAQRCRLPLAAVLPVAGNAELDMAAPQRAAAIDAEAASRREGLERAARTVGVALAVQVRRGPELADEIVAEALERRTDLLVIRRRGKRGLLANLLVGEMVSHVLAAAPCSVLVVPRDGVMWQRAVLVGIDPQQRDPALPAVAAALARECGAALHFVCVVARESERGAAGQALAQAVVDSGWRADGAAPAGALQVAKSLALPSGMPTSTPDPLPAGKPATLQTEVLVGAAPSTLLAAAAARGADLLVVGRSARPAPHGAGRARLGSVAREVTGLATCPVLVHVPTAAEAPR